LTTPSPGAGTCRFDGTAHFPGMHADLGHHAARTVPREAVVSIVAMVEAWPGLLANMLDTVRAREVLEFDHNFRVLDERIERLRRQVTYTAEARWAEVTMEAMNAYDMAKRYAVRGDDGGGGRRARARDSLLRKEVLSGEC
jgi:hypothetical protein